MDLAASVIALESPTTTSNPPDIPYLVIALIAIVTGLVAFIFIRTIAGRSSKR